MKNPRYTEDGGILIEQPNGIDLYVFEGVIKQQAVQGLFGVVDSFVPDISEQEAKIIEIRERRNLLLRSTDWTQLLDIQINYREVFAVYRQALRDVPQQSGFPENFNWPVEPV